MNDAIMNWATSPDVESDPNVVSGAWVAKGTRVQADAVIDKAKDGYTAEDIVKDMLPTIPLAQARRVIEFAVHHEAHSAG